MEKLTDTRKINATVFLFTMTYLVSYMTRINLGAVITAIVEDTGMTKTMISMAVTGSSITYCIGQLLSGWIGDRVSPKKLVFIGLVTSVAMNLLLPICANHYQMTAVWCVNGLAQAFMWPPMVKLMVCLFTATDYQHATTKVCWGSSLGTVIIYLVSPLVIMVASWRALFGITAGAGVLMAVCWLKFCKEPEFEKFHKKPAHTPGGKREKGLFTPLLVAVMVSIVLHGALRDGVTTWMPSYIAETFNLRNEISILAGVILPIFSIFCSSWANFLHMKIKNPVLCALYIYITAALASGLLYCFCGENPIFSVALSAVITGCMHGINLMLNGIAPTIFAKDGNVGIFSGLLNSCTYVGSAISAWLIPMASENAGWNAAIGVWFLVALVGVTLCACCLVPFKKLKK